MCQVNDGTVKKGYCSVNDPDLVSFSSNQDLCSHGTDRNICALYEWTSASEGSWTLSAENPDFDNAILYVNGKEHSRGTRYEMQVASFIFYFETMIFNRLYIRIRIL